MTEKSWVIFDAETDEAMVGFPDEGTAEQICFEWNHEGIDDTQYYYDEIEIE